MIDRFKISVTPVGSAGSATGNTTSGVAIRGKLLAVHCGFGTVHANTDTTIATTSTPTTTILTLTDTNTAGWYYPKRAVHGATGTAATYDGTRAVLDDYYLDDYVKVTLAQSTADECVFTFLVETGS